MAARAKQAGSSFDDSDIGVAAVAGGIAAQHRGAIDLCVAVNQANIAAGGVGRTVVFGADSNTTDGYGVIQEAFAAMDRGEITFALVHEANPLYALPASGNFAAAFAKVGFSGDYGGTYFLTQLLGSAKARELYLLSPVLTAQEAYNLGMVTKVVPDAEIEEAARELAMSLAQGPSIALGFIKRNINNAENMSLEECFDGEAIHHTRAGETADHKEAAKAFVEKRKPAFQGA